MSSDLNNNTTPQQDRVDYTCACGSSHCAPTSMNENGIRLYRKGFETWCSGLLSIAMEEMQAKQTKCISIGSLFSLPAKVFDRLGFLPSFLVDRLERLELCKRLLRETLYASEEPELSRELIQSAVPELSLAAIHFRRTFESERSTEQERQDIAWLLQQHKRGNFWDSELSSLANENLVDEHRSYCLGTLDAFQVVGRLLCQIPKSVGVYVWAKIKYSWTTEAPIRRNILAYISHHHHHPNDSDLLVFLHQLRNIGDIRTVVRHSFDAEKTEHENAEEAENDFMTLRTYGGTLYHRLAQILVGKEFFDHALMPCKSVLEIPDTFGQTILEVALREPTCNIPAGKSERWKKNFLVRLILKHPHLLLTRNQKNGYFPLHITVEENQTWLTNLLLNLTSSVDLFGRHFAAEWHLSMLGSTAPVDVFEPECAQVYQTRMTPLDLACWNGDHAHIRIFRKALLNLQHKVAKSHLEMVFQRPLIFLLYAVAHKRVSPQFLHKYLQILRERELITIDAQTRRVTQNCAAQDTLLHAAVRLNLPQVVRILLDFRASRSLQNEYGDTPLDVYTKHKSTLYSKIGQYLRSYQHPSEVLDNLMEQFHAKYGVNADIMNFLPHRFFCPITLEVIYDPVKASDGFVYEKEAIKRWLRTSNRSSQTNLPLAHCKLRHVPQLRTQIVEQLRTCLQKTETSTSDDSEVDPHGHHHTPQRKRARYHEVIDPKENPSI